MMMLTYWLLLQFCIADRAYGNDAVNALFNELEENSKVLNPQADGLAPLKPEEGTALDHLGKKGRADALDVLVNLYKRHKVTPLQVFGVTTRRDIVIRSRLPFLNKWMQETIRLEFTDRNPDVAAKLLGSAKDILQIAYIGCKGFRCAKPVNKIHSKYQNIMYEAEAVSYSSVKQSINLMKFIRAAVRVPAKADQLLAVCVRIAKKFVKSYTKLEQMTDALIKDSTNADETVEDVKLEVATKWKEARRKMAIVEGRVKAQKKVETLLKKRVDELKKRITSVGINRAKFTAKFLILAATEVKDVEECDSKVLQNYKEVTNYVTNYIKYSKGGFRMDLGVKIPEIGGGNLGIEVKLPEGLKSWKDKKITSIRVSDTVNRRCWKKKDAVHLANLKNKMDAMIKESGNARKEYLTLLKDLKDFQDKRTDMVMGITEGVAKLGFFNDVVTSDYNNAVKGLAFTSVSLKLVKTIFLEAKYFWQSQIEFIEEKLAQRKTADEIINEILLGKPSDRIYKERALRTGMNWLAFASVSNTWYSTMRVQKNRVTNTLVTILTKAEKKNILKNANKVIRDIKELRNTIQAKLNQQKEDMSDKINNASSRLKVAGVPNNNAEQVQMCS